MGLNVWSAIGSGIIALYINKSKGTTQLPSIKKHSSVIISPVRAEASVHPSGQSEKRRTGP